MCAAAAPPTPSPQPRTSPQTQPPPSTDSAPRRWLAERWPWLAGAFAYLVTSLSAAAEITGMRHRSGHELSFAQALLWQATLYACWIPFAWIVGLAIARVGFRGRLFAMLYAASLAAAKTHNNETKKQQARFGDGALHWTGLE